MTDNVTLNQIRTALKYNLESLYDESDEIFNKCNNSKSFFHLNCRGLSSNWDSFCDLLANLHDNTFAFDIIGISEVYDCKNDACIDLPGYQQMLTRCRQDGPRGGVSLFIY
jgi:hypothetical protein